MKLIVFVSLTRRWIILLAVCAGSSFAAERWNPIAIVAQSKISTTGGLILVPASVNGKSTQFILDTGSAYTVIDKSLVRGLIPTERVLLRTMGFSTTTDVCKSPPLEIAGTKCDWIAEVPSINMAAIREQLGAEVYGVVGMNFLCQYVVHLDFDHGTLLLSEATDVGIVPPGIKLPLRRDLSMSPVVEVNMSNTTPREQFVIDTGLYDFGRISSSLANSLRAADAAHDSDRRILATSIDGRARELTGIRCKAFAIGQYKHFNNDFYVDQYNLLGLHWLVKYRTTFDFPRNCLYLQPGDKISLRDRSDGVGFSHQGDNVIADVERGSLAEQAGLQKGDVLTSINGKAVGAWSHLELMNLFSFPTQDDIKIDVRRGNVTITARIPGG